MIKYYQHVLSVFFCLIPIDNCSLHLLVDFEMNIDVFSFICKDENKIFTLTISNKNVLELKLIGLIK